MQPQEKTSQNIWKESAIYYHKNFPSDKKKYCLKELGLTKETIDTYRLGWVNGKLKKFLLAQNYPLDLCQKAGVLKNDGSDSLKGLVIPYWINNQVAWLRGRCDLMKDGQASIKYYAVKGFPGQIFNEEVLTGSEEVIICEDEIECLLLQQLGMNAIAVPGYSSFQKQWVSLFDHCDTVYILFDANGTEKTAALRIGKLLGEKARISSLPDGQSIANLCLDGWGKSKIQKHLNDAKTYIQIKLERIPNLPEAKQRVKRKSLLQQISRLPQDEIAMYRGKVKEHLTLKFSDFDKIIDSFQKEDRERETASIQSDNQAPLDNENTYVSHDGKMCLRKTTKGGTNLVPLCNFTAKISEEIEKDDGVETQRGLSIQGTDCSGNPFETVTVDSAQFPAMNWVMNHWGTRAIIEAGAGNKDHIRTAIQYLSPDVQKKRVYTHTGWREEEGKHIFITSSGALGSSNGLHVELEGDLERYALPVKRLKPKKVQEAIRESMNFLYTAPFHVTAPLWAAMYLAPLSPFLPQDFALWLYGKTGSKKSTLSALALSHFGKFTSTTLPGSWESTTNALEKILFLAKDVPFVIDDFAPQPTDSEANALENKVTHIIRAVGNRSGKARLDPSLKLRETYTPRGLLLSTGEQLPQGHSILARMLTIEIDPEVIKIRKLTKAQKNAFLYPHSMAAYIHWIAERWDQLKEELPQRWERERKGIKASHSRLPEIYASLFLALDTALTFAQEVGNISQREIKKLKRKGQKALRQAVLTHDQQIREENPTQYFLGTLRELIDQGKLYLVDKRKAGKSKRPMGSSGEKLGWIDKKYAYLLPGIAYEKICLSARREGKHFPVKRTQLYKLLAQEGILIPGSQGPTTVINHGSKSERVMRIPVEALYQNEKMQW